MKNIFLLTVIITYYNGYTQNYSFPVSSEERYICEIYEQLYFQNNCLRCNTYSQQDAINDIEKVKKAANVDNFSLRLNYDYCNASASISLDTRLLTLDPLFLCGVNSACNSRWAAISIIAHEIGHHLYGHTIRYSQNMTVAQLHQQELEADKYSGFIMQKLGATINEATMAINIIGTESNTNTHPNKYTRIEYIKKGYEEAQNIKIPDVGKLDNSSYPKVQQPETTNKIFVDTRGNKPLNMIILFNNTVEKFYVFSDGNIMVYNTITNQSFICSRKEPPLYLNWNGIYWAWSFRRFIGNNLSENYVVSTSGEIWALASNGIFTKFGIITNPDF